MRFIIPLILILTICLSSCNDHNKTVLVLKQSNGESDVIYRTSVADFYFGRAELIKYCEKENDGEDKDFTYPQIIEYITTFNGKPVIIPDTLGTKMEVEKEVVFNQSDSLIRVRDQGHPYAYITDEIRWAVIEFAKNEKLRIYHKKTADFLDTIIVDEVDTDWYGETNITLMNDSIIFSQLRWIK
ncbi:hypothetical protein [Tenacibaculum sp. SZ-18]|uniref:hypothetical protein n=1 Tax=Tenacibaculum sp. SZ-18 TaxID=754423 RepID=UPI0012FDE2FE|nr:hypothetical protein [Tenacibaculum sp. SZ-18]